MTTEQMSPTDSTDLNRRVQVHAALADPTRLRIVDLLAAGDASASELATATGVRSNLLAHHLQALERAGLVARRPSEGDGRRSYLSLVRPALEHLGPPDLAARRVVFVCTANAARSHLAAALWRRASPVPAVSAGTHPAERIDPGALAVASRRHLPLPRLRPRHVDEVREPGDLLVTVCDLAHEELTHGAQLHWSVGDPVRIGTEAAFEAAFDEIADRVHQLAPRLRPAS